MKKLLLIASTLLILILSAVTVFAHQGRTDSSGGHYNRDTGEYHYHHGYSEHEHINGVCPYTSDDNTSTKASTTKQDKVQTTKSTTKRTAQTTTQPSTVKNIINKIIEFISNYSYIIFFLLIIIALLGILIKDNIIFRHKGK